MSAHFGAMTLRIVFLRDTVQQNGNPRVVVLFLNCAQSYDFV